MLFSRETRKKLSALRRASPDDPADVSCRRELHPRAEPLRPPEDGPSTAPPARPAGAPVPVEALFPGEPAPGEFGACYVMRTGIANGVGVGPTLLETLGRLVPAAPQRDLAFIDIETLGLASMPVFLVGILRYARGGLRLTQLLARDFPEEAPLLDETVTALEGIGVLFSYNGASFDLPFLEERARYHAIDWQVDAEHIDLLKPARRRFRGRLPDCKLQTLEAHLCGRLRHDDIPGAEIPRRYQDFVRTGDARLLEAIIRHNQSDLLTLAELVPHCLD